MANQLPAARRHQRVNPGLRPANADRTGRNLQARLSATRRGQLFRQSPQIGESWLEAQEPHYVINRAVQLDHLLFRQSGMSGDFAQIRATRPAVHYRDFDKA
ncbi:hypothetical protein D3C72_2199510 [compost metagenome]